MQWISWMCIISGLLTISQGDILEGLAYFFAGVVGLILRKRNKEWPWLCIMSGVNFFLFGGIEEGIGYILLALFVILMGVCWLIWLNRNKAITLLNVDIVKGSEPLVYTGDLPLSSDLYIEQDSNRGTKVYVSSEGTEGNREYFRVYGEEIGTQIVTFQLIQRVSPTLTNVKKSMKITCHVTCSHYYGKGVVTKEPTDTEPGIRTYTCWGCKQTKTEAIPPGGDDRGLRDND